VESGQQHCPRFEPTRPTGNPSLLPDIYVPSENCIDNFLTDISFCLDYWKKCSWCVTRFAWKTYERRSPAILLDYCVTLFVEGPQEFAFGYPRRLLPSLLFTCIATESFVIRKFIYFFFLNIPPSRQC
jgi:hypothetical protein